MHLFDYKKGQLTCERVSVETLAAEHGTPLYIYSANTLRSHYDRMRDAFADLTPLICFSVKSCANTHILRLLAKRGSGFDVVSGGELYRAIQAGVLPERIVFAGVGKTEREMAEALDADIGYLNVESASELEQLARVAGRLGKRPTVAIRVNPDVDAQTHAYTTTGTKTTKFGISIEQTRELFEKFGAVSEIALRGIHLHIGSPVYQTQPYVDAIRRAISLVKELRHAGHTVDTIDIGGGYAAHYEGHEAPSAKDYADAIVPELRDHGLRVILEPGRSIAATAGVLVTRVLHIKETGARRFVIVDASMNELIRPALYQAYHFAWPVGAGDRIPPDWRPEQRFDGLVPSTIVGPVCESSDFLAQDRPLPPLKQGDLVAIFSAGAYAMTMASQYNSRPRAAEVLVDGDVTTLIRRRETYADLVATERIDTTGSPE